MGNQVRLGTHTADAEEEGGGKNHLPHAAWAGVLYAPHGYPPVSAQACVAGRMGPRTATADGRTPIRALRALCN